MTTNNAGWERGWFYLRNVEPGLPAYTGLVLRERPNSWGHGVSTPQHRRRLDSVLAALKDLATRGLIAAGVLAFLHHRRAREEADPVALARSRMLPTPLERAYALTRARSAVDTRMLQRPDRSPWDLEMPPTGPLVSVIPGPVFVLNVAPGP
jgi:hypothetical protein